jgi:hypothetical protein
VHVGPVIAHPVCDLNLQRRIRDARIDALARSVDRRRKAGRRSPLDRLLRREPGERPEAVIDPAVLRDAGEDVAKAFRF